MNSFHKVLLALLLMLCVKPLIASEYNQPLYSLKFNIYGTGAEIYFNDIPAYNHDVQGQTSSQKPIPEYIIDGENILTVKSFPLEEDNSQYQPGAYIEAIISVREKDAPLNESKPILQLKLNPANSEDKLLDGTLNEIGKKAADILEHSENDIIAERKINIKSPFPRWAWQDGQINDDTSENFDSLSEKYKEIWAALNSGDKNKVHSLYDPAAQEFALAYHYQDKLHGHRIMNTGGFINDNEWGLGNTNSILSGMPFRLNIYANGKLANIIDNEHGKSPILYVQKKSQNIAFQKFGFYKNKNNEWVMIR